MGAGRQSMVAYVNIGCYYLIGVPIGAILGYVANLEVKVRSLYLCIKLESSTISSHLCVHIEYLIARNPLNNMV